MHLRQIVTAKETAHLELVAAGLREGGIDAHLLEALCGQQVGVAINRPISLIGRISRSISLRSCSIHQNMVHHLTGVVVVDNVLGLHRGIVTATVAIDDGATHHFQIGLVLFRQLEANITGVGGHLCKRIQMILVTLAIDGMGYFITCCRRLLIIIVTITATKELSDIDLLGISGCVALAVGLARDAHIAVERVVNAVAAWIVVVLRVASALDSRQRVFRHLYTQSLGRTYLACDIISAIYLIRKDIVGSMRTIDMYVGIAADVGHTGTTKHLTLRVFQRALGLCVEYSTDVAGLHRHTRRALYLTLVATTIYVTTNSDLPLCNHCAQEYNYQYGDKLSHSTFN